MKHIRTYENYRVKKNREEIIKESVLQVNDIYKVKTMIDIPQSLMTQISECSPFGFLLFYVKNDGSIDVKADFNSELSESGIRAWATSFLLSLNESEDIKKVQSMLDFGNPPSDELGEE